MTALPLAPEPRGRFQGVRQFLRFNWRFYVAAVVVLLASATALNLMVNQAGWRHAIQAGLALTAAWMTASVVVSHWVYDRSGIYQWAWMQKCVPVPPRYLANIHAGFDETSAALQRLFPHAKCDILDIFDPSEMTEVSIAEARSAVGQSLDAIRADFRALPLPTAKLDAVFLIFAAHEIRQPESRRQFFVELNRVLAHDGRIVLVEHLRDWRNFLAYGPGFFHFHSRRAWLAAAAQGGLVVDQEFGMTPFVRTFVLRKNV